MCERKRRLLAVRPLRDAIGRIDLASAAPLGLERPKAVPTADVQYLFAGEVEGVKGRSDERTRRPGAGCHEAAAEIDRVGPVQRVDPFAERRLCVHSLPVLGLLAKNYPMCYKGCCSL